MAKSVSRVLRELVVSVMVGSCGGWGCGGWGGAAGVGVFGGTREALTGRGGNSSVSGTFCVSCFFVWEPHTKVPGGALQ